MWLASVVQSNDSRHLVLPTVSLLAKNKISLWRLLRRLQCTVRKYLGHIAAFCITFAFTIKLFGLNVNIFGISVPFCKSFTNYKTVDLVAADATDTCVTKKFYST